LDIEIVGPRLFCHAREAEDGEGQDGDDVRRREEEHHKRSAIQSTIPLDGIGILDALLDLWLTRPAFADGGGGAQAG
jgi:hypothetical protein